MRINTKNIKDKISQTHKEFFENFLISQNRKAQMYIIQVGENKVSQNYINIKTKYAQSVGVDINLVKFTDIINTEELIEYIEKINIKADGLIIQLPLPIHINKNKVLASISSEIDIDKLNIFVNNHNLFTQPVVFAINKILVFFNFNLNSFQNIIILGEGSLVGKPYGEYLTNLNISHTILNKNNHKENILENIAKADLLITGIGEANFVTSDMVKEGVVIIDAGTSEDGDSVAGDVDAECNDVASIFASTPGGVGPLTVCGLFENLKIAIQNKVENK